MSWLGGSLSSFTDQISNLTKDILTEGTEEVSDPVTELKLAQAKIRELESVVASQKTENDRFKVFIHEAEERAEASELQVNSISREYRSLLQEKEAEIKELKQKHHEVLEAQMKTALTPHGDLETSRSEQTTHHSIFPIPSPLTGRSDKIAGDEHEFGDSISMQHEINRLSAEVQRLQSECNHWKRLAADTAGKNSDIVQRNDNNDVTHLQTRIKNLQQELLSAKEEHQHEIVALQDHHRSLLASMKHKHQAELEEIRELCEQQQEGHKCESLGNDVELQDEVKKLRQQLQKLGDDNKTLKTQLENSEREKDVATHMLTELELKSAEMKQTTTTLESKVKSLEEELTSLNSERHSLLSDVTRLQDTVQKQEQKLKGALVDVLELGQDNKQVRTDLYNTRQTLLDHLDSNHADVLDILGDLREVRHQVINESLDRQKHLLVEKDELVNLLIAAGDKKSELLNEIKATEQSQQRLEAESQELIQGLGSGENQTLTNSVKSIEEENALLKAQTVKQQERISDLQETLSALTQQKSDFEAQLSKLQEQGSLAEDLEPGSGTESQWDLSLDQAAGPMSSTPYIKERGQDQAEHDDQSSQLRHLETEVTTYKEKIDEFECMRADWQVEKEALEDVLMGLRKQLRDKNAKDIKQKDGDKMADSEHSEPSEDQVNDLKRELQEVRQKYTQLLQSTDQLKVTEDELETLRKQLTEKSSEVIELTTDKTELETSLEELDRQHMEAMGEVIRIRDGLVQQTETLKLKVSEQENKIESLTSEVTQLRSADLTNQSAADLSQNLSEVSMELEKMRAEHDRLVSEREEQSSVMGHVTGALKSRETEVQELQTSNSELEDRVRLKEDQLQETRQKLTEASKERAEAEKAYQDTLSKLQSAEQRLEALEESSVFEFSAQQILESELETLKFQLKESEQDNDSKKSCIQDLKAELDQSREEVVSLQRGKQALEEKLRDSENQMSLFQSRLSEQTESESVRSENQRLITLVEALKVEKESLKKELNQSEQRLQNQHRNYESYIHDMQKSQELDASTLQEEHNKSLQVCHEKDVTISHLEEEIVSLKVELADSKETVNSALDSQQQLSGLVSGKEAEILDLKRTNLHLSEKVDEEQQQVSDLLVKVGFFEGIQKQLSLIRDENHKLKDELLALKTSPENSSVDSDKMEARTLDVMTDMESELRTARDEIKKMTEELTRLNQAIRGKENTIHELNNKTQEQVKLIQDYQDKMTNQEDVINVLQHTRQKKEREIVEVRNSFHRAVSLIDPEKRHILDKPELAQEYPEKGELDLEEQEVRGQGIIRDGVTEMKQFAEVNGKFIEQLSEEANDDVTAEIEQLQNIIKDKDQVISDLQNSNSSFLKMLEGKSLTSSGEKTLVDVHKLENEVRALKTEREQILAVMNEKTRESSKLKSEVHRLMNIISAEKSALDKLMQDNNHLVHKRESSPNPNEDMQKEAIQNLSRIIRDKDLEIESLIQKSETLVKVLQDSSQDGSQISALMLDKENLTKQLAALQNEREQMIAFVNQKHQESVAYHSEVQRLTAYINTEKDKFEKMQNDYANLMPQFEDNKQALLKAQNELINLKQKHSELEVKYGELVQRSNVSETVDKNTYNIKEEQVKKLEERLVHCQSNLQTKEGRINSLNQRISELDISVNSLETEKNNYKKQVEHLTFQMQSLRREVEEVRQESVDVEKGKSQQNSELQTLRENNDQIMLAMREKQFEVNMLKEKCSTLTAMLQQKDGESGQLDRLLRDNEARNKQAQIFQQEKDQLMVVLRQRQTETDQLREQVEKHLKKEQKLNAELDRLRNHLLQIEEGYTQEALAAEEREKELRTRLASAEEKLLSSSAAVANVNLHAGQQLESLQQQLVVIAGQRDAAYHQVATLQEQCQQYAASLANLQLVLEQFQQDREATLASETDRYRSQIAELTREVDRLKTNLTDTQAKLEEASDGLEAASRLSEQLDKKEATIEALREEVQLREESLKAAESDMKKLAITSETRVDKILVKNLLVGYLSTPQKKRNEALKVIGVVLNFSPEDFHRVTGEGQASWIPGFLRFGRSPTTPPVSPTRQSGGGLDKSFSELFVKFLEKESSPPPPVMNLPAEQMAQETQQKHKEKEQSTRPPQFNPFTAPRHAVMPLQVGGRSSPHDSHLLISSTLSPAMPLVAPMSAPEGGITITPVGSGRTTPTSSSAILKDVLGGR